MANWNKKRDLIAVVFYTWIYILSWQNKLLLGEKKKFMQCGHIKVLIENEIKGDKERVKYLTEESP